MYCNQCGKDNKEGAKFCIQCGASLSLTNSSTNAVNIAPQEFGDKKTKLSAGTKTLIAVCATFVLILISGINILSVNMGIVNVSVKDEMQTANMSSMILETDQFIYYISDGLYRADKTTQDAQRISNKNLRLISTSSNAAYCMDENNSLFIVKDNAPEIEKEIDLSDDTVDYIFVNGKYNYYLSYAGVLTKKLNSEKYRDYSADLYTAPEGKTVMGAKLYKDYIYIILTESGSYQRDNTFIRVSVKNGKSQELSDEPITNFYFWGDTIICCNIDGEIQKMNLSGNNVEEIVDTGKTNPSFFIYDRYVYYVENGGLQRFNIDDKTHSEIECENLYMTGLPSGMAYLYRNELILYDYDGNKIAEMKP